MILIAVGSNLASARFGSPLSTCQAALAALAEDAEIRSLYRSRWYRTAPQPVSDQPWYINGVARLETTLPLAALWTRLQHLEHHAERQRQAVNAARTLDLDVLAYDQQVIGWRDDGQPDPKAPLVVPHPRLHLRAFVLRPLSDVAPTWRHPLFGQGLGQMVAALSVGQGCEVL